MPDYAPSQIPGHVRRRIRYLGVWTPADERTDAEIEGGTTAPPRPRLQALEQNVVRLADRSKVLEDLGDLPLPEFDPAEAFPELDEDDQPTGVMLTARQVMTGVRSYLRHFQSLRDLAAEAAALEDSQAVAMEASPAAIAIDLPYPTPTPSEP